MGKAYSHAPRTFIFAACIVVNLAGCVICNFVIVFHLVGNFSNARASDRPHVVIPPIYPFTRFAIIRGPSKISRIDVCGQSFLKPVHLVRAHEVHLARQAGLIACTAQVVCIGRDGRDEFSRIIINASVRWQLPRHECSTPRSTQG